MRASTIQLSFSTDNFIHLTNQFDNWSEYDPDRIHWLTKMDDRCWIQEMIDRKNSQILNARTTEQRI